MRWANILLTMFLAGCVSGQTPFKTEQQAVGNLAGRNSYAFAESPGLAEEGFTSGHLFNPIMQRRIRNELSKELAARGYHEAPLGSASLLVTFSAGGRQDVVTQGGQQGDDVRGVAYAVDRGALVLHFLDPQSRGLIWRGWAEGVISPEEDLDVVVRRAVREIMKPFPPSHS